MDFKEVASILQMIGGVSSKLAKEALLKKYAALPGFQDVLKYIYDTGFTTGLKDSKILATINIDTSDSTLLTPEEIMAYLREHNTGTSADIVRACRFIKHYEDDQAAYWAAFGLCTKDLQIGVSATTLNKVYGKGFIAKVGIMRGQHCPENPRGTYIVTEKIDGNRRIILNKPDGVEIYTRSGKPDYGLVEIAEAAKTLPTGYMYDTECVAMGDFEDSIQLRTATASILNSKSKNKTGIKALIFDMVKLDEYNAGKSMDNALERKFRLATTLRDTRSASYLLNYAKAVDRHSVKNGKQACVAESLLSISEEMDEVTSDLLIPLPVLGLVFNREAALEIAEGIWETGGEGVMMAEVSGQYVVKTAPQSTLLKLKQLKEYELMCVDVYEGDNKYVDMLGGIVVEYEKNGFIYYVKVGSGFTDWERETYWEKPEHIINKIVEIESFGESANQQGGFSLNCPIFVRVKGEAE